MKRRTLIILCMVLAFAVLCCACSDSGSGSGSQVGPVVEEKENPEQILEKMQAALAETPCSQAEVVMNTTLTLDAGENGTVDMTMANSVLVEVCQEPAAARVVTAVDVDYGGETSRSEAEVYSLMENGELVTYTHSQGIWLRLAAEQTVEELLGSASGSLENISGAELDETVSQWQGKEVICLVFQMEAGELESVMGAMDVSGADYSAVSGDVRIYLDAETYLPLAEEMEIHGMDQALAAVYADMGITVEVSSCRAEVSFVSFGDGEAISLPEGAAESAAVWERLIAGDPDNGDGSYTIREGMALVDIAAPEGFTLSEKDYDHVYFTREDYRTVKYTVHYVTGDDMSGATFTAKVDSAASRYEQGGGTVNRAQQEVSTGTLDFTCDMLGVTWGSGREDGYLYAWTVLAVDGSDTYYLFVEVSDGYNDGMGNSKSADITADEFAAYLSAAAPSGLLG